MRQAIKRFSLSEHRSEEYITKRFETDGLLATQSEKPIIFGLYRQLYTWLNPINAKSLTESETRRIVKS